MKSLQAQFDAAMLNAHELTSEDVEKLRSRRLQQCDLEKLMSDYRHKTDLMEYIQKQLSKNRFKDGECGQDFFKRCADELFMERLQTSRDPGIKDSYLRMKRLHPLWGESWWTT